MSAYHQLGHHSESMVLESTLGAFAGVILSPVNYGPDETVAQCRRFRGERGDLDIVFDPQLYVPRTNRGSLQQWPHMPDDLDTHDPSSARWWVGVVEAVINASRAFSPNAICSPSALPRAFDDEFYSMLVETGNVLAGMLAATQIRPMLTALVGLTDLGRNDRYLHVSSLLSRFDGDDIYLVLADDEPPRHERVDSGALEGALRLIRLLVAAQFRVTVAFTSSEMILWKAAGARHVASGKFFNLRRFSVSRWDDDAATGGRNVPYWFEPSLLAFLREADIRRFMREFPISDWHWVNPHSQNILDTLRSPGDTPWLAESWRQFLYWFADCERRISAGDARPRDCLAVAADAWQGVQATRLRMEEPRNDGSWVRAWDIALGEVERRPD